MVNRRITEKIKFLAGKCPVVMLTGTRQCVALSAGKQLCDFSLKTLSQQFQQTAGEIAETLFLRYGLGVVVTRFGKFGTTRNSLFARRNF